MRVKVFISSPYSSGDVAVNVKAQLDCADTLMNHGLVPFTPLLFHFQHMAHPRAYEDWLHISLEWLLTCDCLLRLNGESEGADKEVKFTIANGIKVFYSIESLIEFYKKDGK